MVEGESRPVFHAGAAFVDWQTLATEERRDSFEQQVDDALDLWIERGRRADASPAERRIIHHAPRLRAR